MTGVAHAVRATNYSVSAAPVIVRDVVVVGASIHDGPTHKEWPRGDISGFDVRTGKKLWTLHSIPQKGEFGNETWGDDSWTYTGSTNVWTNMSADEELGYVYLPFGTPTDDFYGGHRPGANLFAESAGGARREDRQARVAFPGRASRRVGLRLSGGADPRRHQRQRQADQGRGAGQQAGLHLRVRSPDRRAGVADRRAAGAAVDRARRAHAPDAAVPDQAARVRAAGRHGSDLIDFTPELKAAALEVFKEFEYGPLFTPPSEKGTIQNPGWAGGANWQGASFDPETGTLYVPSMTSPIVVQLVKPNPERSNLLYMRGGDDDAAEHRRAAAVEAAVRTRHRDRSQSRRHQSGPQAIGDGPRNHPLLKDLNLPPMGAPIRNAALVTKSLLFVAMGSGNLGGGRNLPVGGRPLSKVAPEPTKLRALRQGDRRDRCGSSIRRRGRSRRR